MSQSLVFVSGSSQLNNVARVKPQAKNCYRTNFLKTARSVESKPTLDEAAELLRDLEMAAANVNRAARRFPRAAFTGVSGSVVSISQAGPARDDRIGKPFATRRDQKNFGRKGKATILIVNAFHRPRIRSPFRYCSALGSKNIDSGSPGPSQWCCLLASGHFREVGCGKP